MGIWTDHELVVVGGSGGLAAYNPVGNDWRSLPDPSADGSYLRSLTWTGSELLLFVAPDGIDTPVAGYRVDPDTGRSSALAPSSWGALYDSGILWAGNQAVSVAQYVERSESGLVSSVAYRPATNEWRQLGACPYVGSHLVWTGTYILRRLRPPGKMGESLSRRPSA